MILNWNMLKFKKNKIISDWKVEFWSDIIFEILNVILEILFFVIFVIKRFIFRHVFENQVIKFSNDMFILLFFNICRTKTDLS